MASQTTVEPYYDPEIKAVLDAAPSLGTVNAETLEKIRANRLLLNDEVPLSDEVTRTDIEVPGPDGADSTIRLRIHRPRDAERELPCLYWIHGGGLVLGSPEQDDLRFDRWCQRFGLVGVGVEYRLAPEHRFPAAIDDCFAGLGWVKEHGAEIGVDTSRVGIGGPSAGGGLAAALALRVKDQADFDIEYQILIYPMLDDRRITPTSEMDVPVWDRESNTFGWTSYLGPDVVGGGDVSEYAAAARISDPRGLPPTFIMVGTLDAFADEDIAYAQELNHAGVAVDLHVYAGAPHGFEGFAPDTAVARQARRDVNTWLERQLSRG